MASSGLFLMAVCGAFSFFLLKNQDQLLEQSKPSVDALGSQYYFTAHTLNWEDALTHCQQQGGGKLAEFHSDKEVREATKYVTTYTQGLSVKRAMVYLIQSDPPDFSHLFLFQGGHYWVGGMFKNHKWVWVSGDPLTEDMGKWGSTNRMVSKDSRLGMSVLDRYSYVWKASPKHEKRLALCQY